MFNRFLIIFSNIVHITDIKNTDLFPLRPRLHYTGLIRKRYGTILASSYSIKLVFNHLFGQLAFNCYLLLIEWTDKRIVFLSEHSGNMQFINYRSAL